VAIKFTESIILEAESVIDLNVLITEHLAIGWVCSGGISISFFRETGSGEIEDVKYAVLMLR
jgi:hypothetical protein